MAQCVPLIMRQVSRPTLVSSKNVKIPIVSEFDEIQRVSQIWQDDSNSEIRFIIRDLENFWIFTEIMIFTLFREIRFSRGFTGKVHTSYSV